ncbi:unnamed protein product [Leuciscus chuanchicus]
MRGGRSAMTSRGTNSTERRSQSEPVFSQETSSSSGAEEIQRPRHMQPPPQRGDQREMLESTAINRINSSWEHRPGRTHQFHYLSWTRATPFLLITQLRHTTPQPKCSGLLAAPGPVPTRPALCMFELSSSC